MSFQYTPPPECLFIAPMKGEDSKVRARTDAVYKFLVSEAAVKAGFKPEFIACDEPAGILNRIVHKIKTSHVLVADITGENGSVCYELAYAHTIQKPTVLLSMNGYSVPYDLEGQNQVIYNYDHGGTSLKTSINDLVKHLEHHRNNRFYSIDNPLVNAERAGYPSGLAAILMGTNAPMNPLGILSYGNRGKKYF